MPKQSIVKPGASGKKGILSFSKFLFEQVRANLAHILAENIQIVQKTCFWQIAPGIHGLREVSAYVKLRMQSMFLRPLLSVHSWEMFLQEVSVSRDWIVWHIQCMDIYERHFLKASNSWFCLNCCFLHVAQLLMHGSLKSLERSLEILMQG